MLAEPKGIEYHYFDEKTHTWKIREDAPEWAKDEFKEYQELLNPKPDQGVIKRC